VAATRRKVVQLTPYYPPHLGGVERVAEALARGLSPYHDVEVWTTDLGADGMSGSGDEFPVYRLPAVEVAHTPLAPRLLRLLLDLPTDSVVHVHVAQALWPELVAWAAARRGFSVVAHFHLDVDPTGPAGFLLPWYKRHCLVRTLQRADAVLALTEDQAEFLAEEYAVAPERLRVLRNGVDRAFLELRPTTAEAGRPLRILFVGRLDPQKNVPRLLRALARVPEPVEVVIVGEGQEAAKCTSIRDELGLHHVHFVGAQHGGDLVRWYDWADLFVLPSDREGMPLALLEAMAAGLAVVTTDVSGLPALVGDAGLVVPPGDQHLVSAITFLARDRELLATLQRRSWVRGRSFGWDGAVAQLTRLYDSLPA
jgi:phosphatidylinositol alpha-mannosyltransferase